MMTSTFPLKEINPSSFYNKIKDAHFDRGTLGNVDVFDLYESNVRSYCRSFPTSFTTAKGSLWTSVEGRKFVDFFSGAGTLNYGSNNDFIKSRLIDYLLADGVTHALDMFTYAKEQFLCTFAERILKPRALSYKVQFCGPTGANAVEAALKLARLKTGRSTVFAFMGGFHGLSIGSLATTANRFFRSAAGVPLPGTTFFPFDGMRRMPFDPLDYMEAVLDDGHSGVDLPAAIIFETVQAEGGVNVASTSFLQRLRALADAHGILLICDDIQAGCGRTGTFLSFERAAIVPDIVVLSKAIGGFGLPMSLLLIKPEHDVWQPAQHTGTFRGSQLAFVAATAAIEYLDEHRLLDHVRESASYVHSYLTNEIATIDGGIEIRGIGLIWGIDLSNCGGADFAKAVSARCFELGLIIERVGRDDTVLKILPPLTTERSVLECGLAIIRRAVHECLNRR